VIRLTLYTRAGCHLCETMRDVVTRVAVEEPGGIEIEEIDVSTHADLEARFGLEIPVLLIEGRKAAKYRIDEPALRRLIRSRSER